jgi:hypothetical protein
VKMDNVLLKHSLLEFVGEALSPKTSKPPLQGYENFVKTLKNIGARSTSFVNSDYIQIILNIQNENKSKKKNNKKTAASTSGNSSNSELDGSGVLKNWKKFNF